MNTQLIELKSSRRFKVLIRVLFPFFIAASIAYIVWRLVVAHSWHTWYAYPLVFLEIYSIAMTFLFLITSLRIYYPVWTKPQSERTVDVFIPTYNESEEIVKMTTISAMEMKGVRNVFVLDDGNRKSIKRLAERLGAVYIARKENSHAKAGNLNNALNYTDAEFIICLDCDHVPQRKFVARTLGYFRDEALAFVQSPQSFYNRDSIQFRKNGKRKLWNEQTMFYESIQPTKNAFNAAFFCGSGAIIRRTALDSIGGFATGTVTEDIHTSIRLHSKGWKSYYVNEQLAYGIAPSDLIEYHKQRVRWGAGSVFLLFRSKESPLRIKGLTLMQRICYFNSMVGPLNGAFKLFYLLLPSLILITIPFEPVSQNVNVLAYFSIFIPYYALSYLTSYVYSRGTFRPIHSEQFNIANILANLMAIVQGFGNDKKFVVSSKGGGLKEESNTYRLVLCLWTLAFITDIASLNFWFIQTGNDFGTLLNSLTGVSLFWNTFNLVFLSAVVWFLNKHNETIFSNHIVSCDITALELKTKASVQINRISLRGAVFSSKIRLDAEDIKLVIPVKGTKPAVLYGRIASVSKNQAGNSYGEIIFTKVTDEAEKALTLLMFDEVIPDMHRKDLLNKKERRELFALTPEPVSLSSV